MAAVRHIALSKTVYLVAVFIFHHCTKFGSEMLIDAQIRL